MANAKKKTRQHKPVGSGTSFAVRVFADEYAGLGVDATDDLATAQTKVRQKLDVPNPARRRVGGGSGKGAIRAALSDATPEQLAQIKKVLGQ